jgi:hypothetical protein
MPNISLEELCRALAAHAVLIAKSDAMQGFFAPEYAQSVADFIYGFAKGEEVSRPKIYVSDDDGE